MSHLAYCNFPENEGSFFLFSVYFSWSTFGFFLFDSETVTFKNKNIKSGFYENRKTMRSEVKNISTNLKLSLKTEGREF